MKNILEVGKNASKQIMSKKLDVSEMMNKAAIKVTPKFKDSSYVVKELSEINEIPIEEQASQLLK